MQLPINWLLGRSPKRAAARLSADVLQVPLENVSQAHDQRLLLDTTLPESSDYLAGMKGTFWVASDLQYFIAAWNTNLWSRKKKSPSSMKILPIRAGKTG